MDVYICHQWGSKVASKISICLRNGESGEKSIVMNEQEEPIILEKKNDNFEGQDDEHIIKNVSQNFKESMPKNKITVEVVENDSCLQKDDSDFEDPTLVRPVGVDPRFQQQDITLRCSLMYKDFYRCEYVLGQGHNACSYFKDVFRTICPSDTIERWDKLRTTGQFKWVWFQKRDD